jgi:hypothetical protein
MAKLNKKIESKKDAVVETTSSEVKKAKGLLEGLTTKKPVSKKTTQSRPTVDLTNNTLGEVLVSLGTSKVAFSRIESRLEQDKAELYEFCFDYFVKELWVKKSRPANFDILVTENNKPHVTATFQTQDRFSFNFPDKPEDMDLFDHVKSVIAELWEAEVDGERMASNLVLQEFELSPVTTIDFNRLLEGHYEGEGKNRTKVEASEAEKAVAQKLIRMIQVESLDDFELFTQEERDILISQKDVIRVKKNFLERVANHCPSLEAMRKLFVVVKPVMSFHPINFGVSLSDGQKADRVSSYVAKMFNMIE